MTPTIRIRILWSVLAILVILGGLAAASPYLINTRVVKKQISKQISDWMGLPVTVRGEPVVTVFPYLTVKLKDMQVASNLGPEEPPLVSMETLKAEMHWLPMLFGKFEVRRFYFENPVFELVRNADGVASWDMTRGSLVSPDASNGGLMLSDITLGNFRIAGGKAHLVDDLNGYDEFVSDIDMNFDWPNTGKAASIDGRFKWRGEPITLDAASDMPMELFDGGLSPLSLKISSPQFKMQIDGTAATMANVQLEGDFSFETSSLRSILSWLDMPVRPGEGLGKVSLSARSHLIGASVAFADMKLMLDDNKADGVLQLDFRRERALIQGTLASDKLDLGPYLSPRLGSGSVLDYNLSSQDLGRSDLDIRLSANKMSIGSVQLGRTAATLVTRNNQLSFSIGEAFAYGGRIEAGLELHPSKEDAGKMTGHLRTKANGLLAGSFAREVLGSELLSGTSSAEIDLQGEGQSLRQMLNAAHGELSLVVTEGKLGNFSLENLQKALEAEQSSQPEVDALYDGTSEFDVLSVRGRVANDMIDIDGLRMTSGNKALLGTIDLDLSSMQLDFPGTLAVYRSADPATHSTEAPVKEMAFHLAGALPQPKLTRFKPGDQPAPQGKDILAPGVPTKVGPQQPSAAPEKAPSETAPSQGAPLDGETGEKNADDVLQTTPANEAPLITGSVLPATGSGEADRKSFGEAAEEFLRDSIPAKLLNKSLNGVGRLLSSEPAQ